MTMVHGIQVNVECIIYLQRTSGGVVEVGKHYLQIYQNDINSYFIKKMIIKSYHLFLHRIKENYMTLFKMLNNCNSNKI